MVPTLWSHARVIRLYYQSPLIRRNRFVVDGVNIYQSNLHHQHYQPLISGNITDPLFTPAKFGEILLSPSFSHRSRTGPCRLLVLRFVTFHLSSLSMWDTLNFAVNNDDCGGWVVFCSHYRSVNWNIWVFELVESVWVILYYGKMN